MWELIQQHLVNGIHFKRFTLQDAQSINFGIRDPIILQGITNVFEIRIERDGKVVTDRSILEKIAITHFVIVMIMFPFRYEFSPSLSRKQIEHTATIYLGFTDF